MNKMYLIVILHRDVTIVRVTIVTIVIVVVTTVFYLFIISIFEIIGLDQNLIIKFKFLFIIDRSSIGHLYFDCQCSVDNELKFNFFFSSDAIAFYNRDSIFSSVQFD